MILEVKGLTKQFGGLTAVSEVTLGVEEGMIYGLIGPNGAGKTTCFNMITGLLTRTSGEVHFQGERLSGLKPHQVTMKGLARTFQNIRLFADMTALETVIVGRHCRTQAGVWSSFLRSRAQRREEAANLAAAEELLAFVGLSEVAGRPSTTLSYGQQRRLEIARALATEPRMLCLDEPAAGMNEHESRALVDLIRRIQAKGITVLLIEHDMHVVMNLCDRIAVLNFGKQIADGTPTEIQANQDVIEAYLGRDDDAAS
jgi:branched-chain amino acid transport system ATP-binding protein